MVEIIKNIERDMALLWSRNIEPTKVFLGKVEFDAMEAYWRRYFNAHGISKTGGLLLGLKLHFVEDETHLTVA